MTEHTRPQDADNECTGPVSSALFRMDCQMAAVDVHAAAEGIDISGRVVLDSYDRALHPWMHGRRPEDLAASAREWGVRLHGSHLGPLDQLRAAARRVRGWYSR